MNKYLVSSIKYLATDARGIAARQIPDTSYLILRPKGAV